LQLYATPESMAGMSDIVWLLWFEREKADGEETGALLGVYRTEEDAKAAIIRMKDKPGFRDRPQGFRVYDQVIGRDFDSTN
jgi:hypothetical protein